MIDISTFLVQVPESKPEVKSTPAPAPPAAKDDNDPFKLSAAEARARLTRKKKPDPRHDHLSMKEKYSLFQNLWASQLPGQQIAAADAICIICNMTVMRRVSFPASCLGN